VPKLMNFLYCAPGEKIVFIFGDHLRDILPNKDPMKLSIDRSYDFINL
jgi:hypothetical protein